MAIKRIKKGKRKNEWRRKITKREKSIENAR